MALSQSISMDGRRKIRFEVGVKHGANIIRKLLKLDWPQDTLMNINFPDIEPDQAQVQVLARGDLSAKERDALVKAAEDSILTQQGIRDFYGKSYDASDIRQAINAAISIKVIEPVFESQTKTKLGSTEMGLDSPTVRIFNSFAALSLT